MLLWGLEGGDEVFCLGDEGCSGSWGTCIRIVDGGGGLEGGDSSGDFLSVRHSVNCSRYGGREVGRGYL